MRWVDPLDQDYGRGERHSQWLFATHTPPTRTERQRALVRWLCLPVGVAIGAIVWLLRLGKHQ